MEHRKRQLEKTLIGTLIVSLLAAPATTGLGEPLELNIGGHLWSTDGTNASWDYGSGANGQAVWATGLEAPHNREECSWIESPPLPGALFADGTLEVRHTLDMEDAVIGWHYAIDGGLVVISKDGGTTWTKVAMDYPAERIPASPPQWPDIRPCIGEMTGEENLDTGFFSGQATNMTDTGNTGEISPSDLVQVRLVFFADHAFTVELIGGTLGRDGWQVHGVTLGGVDLMPLLGLAEPEPPI